MFKHYETASTFWMSRESYPNYPSVLQRRFIDLAFVLNYTLEASSVLDLGCGDGSLLVLLRELSEIKDFYAYDLSVNLINSLERRWLRENNRYLYTKVCNFVEESSFPDVDLMLCFGLFPYIFDLADLEGILEKIKAPNLLVRSPCNIGSESVLINKYSEELVADYSAIYRTSDEYVTILSKHFEVKEVTRMYPDSIESKYGTKHFFFVCKTKNGEGQ